MCVPYLNYSSTSCYGLFKLAVFVSVRDVVDYFVLFWHSFFKINSIVFCFWRLYVFPLNIWAHRFPFERETNPCTIESCINIVNSIWSFFSLSSSLFVHSLLYLQRITIPQPVGFAEREKIRIRLPLCNVSCLIKRLFFFTFFVLRPISWKRTLCENDRSASP